MEIMFEDKPSKGLTFGDLKPGDIYRLADGNGYAYLCFYDGLRDENRSINLTAKDTGRTETYGPAKSERVVLLEQTAPLVLADKK